MSEGPLLVIGSTSISGASFGRHCLEHRLGLSGLYQRATGRKEFCTGSHRLPGWNNDQRERGATSTARTTRSVKEQP